MTTSNDGGSARAIMAALYQHRMATADQIHELVSPHVRLDLTRRRLNGLRKQGVADRAVVSRRRQVWYLTDRGRAIGDDFPEMRDRTCPPAPADPFAAKMRTSHTLAVLDAHLAFLRDARKRGDEYGTLDWAPEVHHRIVEQGTDSVIADALMRYTVAGRSRALHRAFIEVDRGTMVSEDLAGKLMRYARFHQLLPMPAKHKGTVQAQSALPAWQYYYPSFPKLLFILTGTGPAAQAQRIRDMQILAKNSPLVARMFQAQVRAGAVSLKDIEEQGPSAPIWTSLTDQSRPACSWTEL